MNLKLPGLMGLALSLACGCRSISYQPQALATPPDSARCLNLGAGIGTSLGFALWDVGARAQWRPIHHLTVGATASAWQRYDAHLGESGSGAFYQQGYDHYARKGRTAGANIGWISRVGSAELHLMAGGDYSFISRSYETIDNRDVSPYAYSLSQEYRYVRPWAQLGVSYQPHQTRRGIVLLAFRLGPYLELSHRERFEGEMPYRKLNLSPAVWMPQLMVGGEGYWGPFFAGGQLQYAHAWPDGVLGSRSGPDWWQHTPISVFAYAGYRIGWRGRQ